jgi:hypothetical protein
MCAATIQRATTREELKIARTSRRTTYRVLVCVLWGKLHRTGLGLLALFTVSASHGFLEMKAGEMRTTVLAASRRHLSRGLDASDRAQAAVASSSPTVNVSHTHEPLSISQRCETHSFVEPLP